ncbi:MAG: PorP/SprF family type IX secretion system membrane protein [Flavobacteriales bacterium]|nr:PorP/SprF family type IX secretion system membrane protein [Flavobacteriales bacterium]
MKLLISIVFIVFLSKFSISQDIHLSMWDMSPLNLNPANTGMFDGDYRINANHRNQWSSVTVPFTTYAISADAKNVLGHKPYSAGLQINQDRAGDSKFNTFQVNLSGAYALDLNGDSLNQLSFGTQLGITNKNLTYNPLQFDVQYDGFQYDASLPNQENFARASRVYANLGLGVGYFRKLDVRKVIQGGISAYNLLKPKQSFFNDDDIRLDVRYNFNINAEWKLADKWDLLPNVLLSSQGKYKELNLGANARYVLTDFMGMYRAVWAGVFYRNKDATFISIGMNYDAWKVGISYDINLSTLKPASNLRGGFEIGVQYIIKFAKPQRVMHRICPDYI